MEKKKQSNWLSFLVYVLIFYVVKIVLDGFFLEFLGKTPAHMISEWLSKIF